MILLCVFKKFSHASVVTGALVLHQGRTTYKVQNSPRGFGNFWFNLRDKITGRGGSAAKVVAPGPKGSLPATPLGLLFGAFEGVPIPSLKATDLVSLIVEQKFELSF